MCRDTATETRDGQHSTERPWRRNGPPALPLCGCYARPSCEPHVREVLNAPQRGSKSTVTSFARLASRARALGHAPAVLARIPPCEALRSLYSIAQFARPGHPATPSTSHVHSATHIEHDRVPTASLDPHTAHKDHPTMNGRKMAGSAHGSARLVLRCSRPPKLWGASRWALTAALASSSKAVGSVALGASRGALNK